MSDKNFKRKKDAKKFACMLAVKWLSENGYMAPTNPTAGTKTVDTLEPSAAAVVVTLCLELKICVPAYVLRNDDPALPMLWSGYAHFPMEPSIDAKIGEFTNVFGKKKAKEACVERVLEFLESMKHYRQSSLTLPGRSSMGIDY